MIRNEIITKAFAREYGVDYNVGKWSADVVRLWLDTGGGGDTFARVKEFGTADDVNEYVKLYKERVIGEHRILYASLINDEGVIFEESPGGDEPQNRKFVFTVL